MTRFRYITLFLLLMVTFAATGFYSGLGRKTLANKTAPRKTIDSKKDGTTLSRIKEKVALLPEYLRKHQFSNDYCFLVDMRIASGKERFFVYNMETGQVERSGLVAHGSGSDTGAGELYFSNTPNSNCTSLGRYRIGKSYYGRFGLAYKLFGLDETNSNAFERFVVLHAHECVPVGPIEPQSLCLSWGCPTVAPSFLQELKTYIDQSDKPILMWIYY